MRNLFVVRNLPLKEPIAPNLTRKRKNGFSPIDKIIPGNKNLLIFQGAGINESRGAEEMVYSMIFLDSANFHLLIIGGGDVFGKLKKIIEQNHLSEKITLFPKVPFALLVAFYQKSPTGNLN